MATRARKPFGAGVIAAILNVFHEAVMAERVKARQEAWLVIVFGANGTIYRVFFKFVLLNFRCHTEI